MGGILAANRLIEANCKNIIQLRGPHTLTPANDRSEGFLQTLKKHSDIQVQSLELEFTSDTTQTDIQEFLKQNPEIDGIFAASDLMAANCIRCLKKLGRRVPEDIKIIGYDNISICEYTDPTISTIAQPITEMGEMAAETLFKLINNEPINQLHMTLPVELIERESTKSE